MAIKRNSSPIPQNGKVSKVGIEYSGPLPIPAHLEKYEKIVPGAAKIIIDMAKSQSEHRQKAEMKMVEGSLFCRKLGLWLGITACGFFIGLAAYAVNRGMDKVAITAMAAPAAGIITAFIYGGMRQKSK